MSGYSLGSPGGSLKNDSFVGAGAGAKEAGRVGEVKTGVVLNRIAQTSERVVLHDLDIPGGGLKANIDHVVIGEGVVLVIDSKNWAPGIYWTLGGVSRRGMQDVPHADKQTMQMIQDRLAPYLPGYLIRRPVLAIWSSKDSARVRTGLLTVPGADAIRGESLERRIKKVVPDLPPEPGLTEKMTALLRSGKPKPPRRRLSL